MFYQEKRILVSLVTSILVLGFYSLYVYMNHYDTILSNPNDFKFWGKTFLILIPVSVVAQIIIHILFVIIHKITTREDPPHIEDERDKLINLKGSRVAHYVFMLGFLLSMGTQAMGMQPWVMFISLVTSGFLAALCEEMFKFYLYRKGV